MAATVSSRNPASTSTWSLPASSSSWTSSSVSTGRRWRSRWWKPSCCPQVHCTQSQIRHKALFVLEALVSVSEDLRHNGHSVPKCVQSWSLWLWIRTASQTWSYCVSFKWNVHKYLQVWHTWSSNDLKGSCTARDSGYGSHAWRSAQMSTTLSLWPPRRTRRPSAFTSVLPDPGPANSERSTPLRSSMRSKGIQR